MTAASLENTGSIYLTGSVAKQALLDVTTGVAGFGTAGVLSGNVDLSTYSGGLVNLSRYSAIEFASGQITSLAANAQLQLFGDHAFIEDSAALGSNSALTGLASISSGAALIMNYGASVSTSGALVNNGSVGVDTSGGTGAVGGSNLTVGGALTNSGSLTIGSNQIGSGTGLPLSKVSTTALTNTGFIGLTGPGPELLDVTGAAGFGTVGRLTGSVVLSSSSGNNTAIEFLSGQISTIGAGSELSLYGNGAFIEDSTALGSNSALTGLADIKGILSLGDGASVSTSGALVNDGHIDLSVLDVGLPALSIGGALTNNGTVKMSNSTLSVAGPLTNTGTLDIGSGGSVAVSGAATNDGSISIASDTEELAGKVSGTGSFSLSTANLQFDSSVSSGQTITETGADALTLNGAQSFAATISGFGTGDTIDATNFLKTATTYNFVENLMGAGGTLTLTDTSQSLTANILMTGDYSNKSFSLAPDSGTGTLVKFV